MLRKGLRKDILIFLAAVADEIENQSLRYQLWRLWTGEDFKSFNFSRTVSKILSIKEIEKVEKNGRVFYKLTSKGLEGLSERIPVLKLAKRPWDGYWRIVIFDIEEKRKILREKLRSKLLSLGFGMWQKSVYVTPHDIEEEINGYLKSNNLYSSCVCLVAKRSDLGDEKALAEKVWQLEKLNDEYEELTSDCQRLEKEKIKSKEFSKIWTKYKELILKDPHLPKQLLPSYWKAEKARKVINSLYLRISDRISLNTNQ